MLTKRLQIPYRRPISLSDPYQDWPNGWLRDLLKTPDEEMDWNQFREIFQVGLPAGVYEEVVYFLPFALGYALRHPSDALEYLAGVVSWVSENDSALTRDNLREPVRNCFRHLIGGWTETFKVIHFDEQTCRSKGFGVKFYDYVENSDSVVQMIEDLLRFEKQQDLADEFVAGLAGQEDTGLQSAWLLELAHELRQRYVYWPGRIQGENVTRLPFPTLDKLILDMDLLQSHLNRIRNTLVAEEPSPTYWRTLCAEIGIRYSAD